jgi:hypothetical protein
MRMSGNGSQFRAEIAKGTGRTAAFVEKVMNKAAVKPLVRAGRPVSRRRSISPVCNLKPGALDIHCHAAKMNHYGNNVVI